MLSLIFITASPQDMETEETFNPFQCTPSSNPSTSESSMDSLVSSVGPLVHPLRSSCPIPRCSFPFSLALFLLDPELPFVPSTVPSHWLLDGPTEHTLAMTTPGSSVASVKNPSRPAARGDAATSFGCSLELFRVLLSTSLSTHLDLC